MFLDTALGSVFGEASETINATLKNPNQFREAVVLEALRNLPAAKRKEFSNSKEAKFMIEEGIITQEMLDRLNESKDCSTMKIAVCNIAKENNDPLFDELLSLRIQERRVMNELIEKYHVAAEPVAANADADIVDRSIPAYFRS